MKPSSSTQKLQEEQYKFPYHYLDLHSDFYNGVFFREYYSRIKIIKELLRPFKGQSILDAACGDGRFCYELKDEDVNIVGVDYSQRAITFAKTFNPSVEFHTADLTDFHLDKKFDYITLIEALEHISPETLDKVILNLWRVLNDNGRLVVTVPTTNVPVSDKHYQHFTMEALEKLFEPLFEPVKKVGQLRTGISGKYWAFLQRCGILVWWMRKRVPGVRCFLNYIYRYYDRRIENCSLEQAAVFIVVFKKKPGSVD